MKRNEIQPPKTIEVRGAHIHNLKNIDVDIPLWDKKNKTSITGKYL